MSWPDEEWKVGLPSRALRAIAEVEQRLERAGKEHQQKQAQLDALEALVHKQRLKHDEEKAAWALLSQENRSLAEACEQLERSRQRLAQELQAKEAHLGCLEAQMAQATRRQAELEGELRRCQGELKKLQSPQVSLPSRRGSPTPWAEGGVEAKTEHNRTPPSRVTELEPNSTTLGEPCAKNAPSREAGFPGGPQESPDPTGNGDQARPLPAELALTGEKLKTDNQELRLALTRAESQIQEKEHGLRSLQGQLEMARLELAQWKQQRGRGDQAEPAGIWDCRGRRLSEDVVRRSREQEKGLAGTERAPSGGSRRSASSSRLEQLVEKRVLATRPKGVASLGPKALSAERNQEEMQALRTEVATLRRRLEAADSQRRSLLESCWQQQRTRAWVQERQTPLLGLRAASWQRKKEGHPSHARDRPQALAFVADRKEFGTRGKEVLDVPTGGKSEPGGLEEAGSEPGTPAKEETPPGSSSGDLSEIQASTGDRARPEGNGGSEETLEALRETIRTLTAGKAEAESQAGLVQQKLQSLQDTLGRQTDRLARALEAQSRHVEELVADAEEKGRLARGLREELEVAKAALEAANAETQRLQALWAQGEEERRGVGAEEVPGLHRAGEASERTETLALGGHGCLSQNGLAAHTQEEKHAQAELETFLAQLLRENQALRTELIHWEAMLLGQGDFDSCSISSKLHGEATAGSVLQASQKVALLIRESQRDVQTQTEGFELGVQRRRRERVSVAFDDTQYEPYGLPEVVMKGFADIPSGPSCPYVLRRGILGSAPVAQLAPKAVPEEDGLEAEEGVGV